MGIASSLGKRSEQAPLLANGDAGDEESIDSGTRRDDTSDQNWVQRSWRWVRSHWIILALVLLLIGGAIVLILYFKSELLCV